MSGRRSHLVTADSVTCSMRIATSTETPRFFHWEKAIGVTFRATAAARCEPKNAATRPRGDLSITRTNKQSVALC